MLPFNLFRVFTITAGLLSSVTLSAWAADDAATSAQPHPVDVPNPIYGDPQAPIKMKYLREQMQNTLQSQRATDYFARFQSYLAEKLQQSAGSNTGSELTGNGRLSSYEHMLRDPLQAPAEAEQFTRQLHKAIVDDPSGLGPALATASQSLDLGRRTVRAFAKVSSPEQALDVVKKALEEARIAHARALAPLNKAEIDTMVSDLYPVLVSENQAGHTLNDRVRGRALVDLMEKMDRQALIEAAEAIVPLTDPKLLDQLKQLPADGNVAVEGVTGHVVAKIDTPAGTILIGGKESKTYKLDEMKDVAVVIDLGHGNTYEEGTTSLDRPVLIVLNLGGGNIFHGKKPGIQGAAMLGVSLVVNREGNNSYQADDLAQASAIAGVGIIVEHGGKNTYRGVRRVQGQALGGVGILIGRGGQNDYHAAMWAQGFGAPLGFGLLEDTVGHDHYYCGGLYITSYKHPTNSRIPATPGYEGFGQGVGAGIRQVGDGGIGIILNGGGHNVYEFDYLSHGGGYWCGMGFARDFGGNSQRLIARTAWDGSARTEPLFQRFGCGWGCHYSVGFLFDDGGNSLYEGTIMGAGMGWDCSVGALCSFGEKDHFKTTGGLTQGCGAQASLGILYHYGNDAVYEGGSPAYAPPGISYHKWPACGGNFSFVINEKGNSNFSFGGQQPTRLEPEAGGPPDRPERRFFGRRFDAQ